MYAEEISFEVQAEVESMWNLIWNLNFTTFLENQTLKLINMFEEEKRNVRSKLENITNYWKNIRGLNLKFKICLKNEN